MQNYNTTRVMHIDRVRTAYLMWKDIPIATLSEEFSSLSGEFDWVIRPLYENFDEILRRGGYIDIPGIDIDLHKDEYVRRYVPIVVSQRTPPRARPDVMELMAEVGLDEYDLFEFMCRSHSATGNNDYYVSRTPDKVVDVDDPRFPYDIPDFDTDEYGWLSPEERKRYAALGVP